MKKILSVLLAAVLVLGLVPAATAYTTADFSDVPSTHWAYDAVMRMADKGIIQGTGDREFSPNATATAAHFLTLVGRIVFPEVVVSKTDTWYGPYVAKAQETGMLDGSQVDVNNVTAEITRYDMAVILRAAAKKLGKAETLAETTAVGDYGMIPTMYADAVRAVYGMELITGDENKNFNGSNSMRRSELAVVIDRVVSLKASGSANPGNTTTEPAKSDYEKQTTEEYLESNQEDLMTYTIDGYFQKTDHDIGRPAYNKYFYDFPDMPYKVYYTKDGGKTSVLVAEGVTGNSSSNVHGERSGEFTFEIQLPKDAFVKDWNQQGIYFSAETELDGQKLVTSDLRTDGRAYVTLTRPNVRLCAELTPPTGEKAKVTFSGAVGYYDQNNTSVTVGAGFTVCLYLKDGTLLGETQTYANGHFSMECEVDEIDNGFNVNTEQYYVTASGIQDGVKMEYTARRKNGELVLWSLDFIGANPNNPSGMPIIVK